ncbi:uncharacterized protein LOC130010833, partial [Patella vulgata]|uniref:uncharacterized protein LOC130010833 n=1 Tax=Patella vulgata TaxID=6465 RepID=UPI0024A9F7EC
FTSQTYSSYSDLLKLTNQQLDKIIRSHSLVPKNKHLEKIDQLSSVLHLKPHEIIKYEDLCKLNDLELKDLLRRNHLEVIGKRTHHLAQLSSIYKFNQSTSVVHQHICDIKNSVKGWTQNLKYLPSTTLSQIVEYLINAHDIKTCSSNFEEFTSETLKRYKALRSYELWASGHIHSVRFNNLADNYSYCALRCKSNPSWDTSGTVYDTCIVLDKSSGKPLGGHCSCAAGLIEACSHVAGLLFGLEDIVSKGLTELPDTSCTSILCSWSAPKSKNIQVKPLKDVPIVKRGPIKVVTIFFLKSSIFNPVNPLKAGVKFEKAQQLFHELNLCRPNLPWLKSVDLNKWRPVNNKPLQTFGPSDLKDIYNLDAVELCYYC